MAEGEFYDALDEFPFDENEDSKKKPSWKQRKMMQ